MLKRTMRWNKRRSLPCRQGRHETENPSLHTATSSCPTLTRCYDGSITAGRFCCRKARLIRNNPFEELKTGSLANRKRQYIVSGAETRKLLEACSGPEWRTLIALARYGGLRSEF